VLASGVAVAAAAAWVAWIALGQLRAVVAGAHRRVLYWAYRRSRAFEAESALGALLRPSRVFASRSDRDGALVAALQQRYVAGELDERAFERELARLLGDGVDVGRTVRREIAVTAPDGGDDETSGATDGDGTVDESVAASAPTGADTDGIEETTADDEREPEPGRT
jgi:hypothetical protein